MFKLLNRFSSGQGIGNEFWEEQSCRELGLSVSLEIGSVSVWLECVVHGVVCILLPRLGEARGLV